HDQFSVAPVRHGSLSDHRYQQEQLVPRVAHTRRRLAQQPSPFHGVSAPRLLLVGNRYYLLPPKALGRLRTGLGSAPSPRSSSPFRRSRTRRTRRLVTWHSPSTSKGAVWGVHSV